MPALEAPAAKKSWILLPLIMLPALALPLLPRPCTAFAGRLVPAGPMSLFDTVLLLLPPATVLVLNSTVPVAAVVAPVAEPRIVVLVTVLLVAPSMKRIVLVPAVPDAVAFDSVNALPPLLRPSMVTLSAPFRLISALPAVIAPLTVRAAPPSGRTVIAV